MSPECAYGQRASRSPADNGGGRSPVDAPSRPVGGDFGLERTSSGSRLQRRQRHGPEQISLLPGGSRRELPRKREESRFRGSRSASTNGFWPGCEPWPGETAERPTNWRQPWTSRRPRSNPGSSAQCRRPGSLASEGRGGISGAGSYSRAPRKHGPESFFPRPNRRARKRSSIRKACPDRRCISCNPRSSWCGTCPAHPSG